MKKVFAFSQKYLNSGSHNLIASTRHFRFFMKFLTTLVPFEPFHLIKVRTPLKRLALHFLPHHLLAGAFAASAPSSQSRSSRTYANLQVHRAHSYRRPEAMRRSKLRRTRSRHPRGWCRRSVVKYCSAFLKASDC